MIHISRSTDFTEESCSGLTFIEKSHKPNTVPRLWKFLCLHLPGSDHILQSMVVFPGSTLSPLIPSNTFRRGILGETQIDIYLTSERDYIEERLTLQILNSLTFSHLPPTHGAHNSASFL